MCLPVIGAVVGLAGSVVSGIAAARQVQNQADNLEVEAQNRDIEADMQERQAEIEKQTAVYEADRTRDVIRRTMGAQRAAFASNGIALDGSAVDVLEDTAMEGALDIAAIEFNSKLKTDNLKYESRVSRMNAGVSRANAAETRSGAGLAFLAPVIGGVARLGGAFS